MRLAKTTAGLAACMVLGLVAAQPAAAAESAVWLNVEIRDGMSDGPKVKINIPISMMEVVVNSLDTATVLRDLHDHDGIDLAELWRNLRDADTDEFVRIEKEGTSIKVFKEDDTLRVVVHEPEYDEPNVQVRIPFQVMDYLVEGRDNDEFRLSEMIDRLKGHLPLVLVDAKQEDESVRIWLEER